MRKLPFGPVSVQVWYIVNGEEPAAMWESINCKDAAEAYREVADLTANADRDMVRTLQCYIIEFQGKIIGEQTNDYPV